jgi:hypothetical protein
MKSNIKVLNVDNFNKYFEINDNSFIEHFNNDLEIFIKNIIKDENKVTNIISQISEYWDKNISKISWIDKCINVTCDDNIKLINNGDYENFLGYCNNVIVSFYKILKYKFNDIVINNNSLPEIFYNNMDDNEREKLEENYNKFIELKKKKDKEMENYWDNYVVENYSDNYEEKDEITSYKNKYFKYKNKYLLLKKYGGNQDENQQYIQKIHQTPPLLLTVVTN